MADFWVLAWFAGSGFAGLAGTLLSDVSDAGQAWVAGLIPVWVGLTLHYLNCLADAGQRQLIGHPDGSWTTGKPDGPQQSAQVFSNFQCRWVVLITIMFGKRRSAHLIWRHIQLDHYRHLLARLARQSFEMGQPRINSGTNTEA